MADVFNNQLKLGFGLMRLPKNPDGSIVAVLLNPGTKKLYINLRMEDRCYPVELPAGGVMTAFMNAVK